MFALKSIISLVVLVQVQVGCGGIDAAPSPAVYLGADEGVQSHGKV